MPSLEDIGDDEIIYRKIPVKPGWFDAQKNEVKPDAFHPRPDDVEGISVDRAQSTRHPEYRNLEEAAAGPSADGYYVAVLRVGDLRTAGLNIRADPIPESPGHALITDLTYQNRKTENSVNLKVLLAHRLVDRVAGPFPLATTEDG